MLKRIILAIVVLAISAQAFAQNQNAVLLISFQKQNISINGSMKNYAKEHGITEAALHNKIMASALKSFQDVTARNKFEVKGMDDQVSLLSSEFAELVKKDKIDKVSEEQKQNFWQRLLNIFRESQPRDYMSANFSADKIERIKTTLKQQNSKYAIILHKYEIVRKPCGAADMITHYSVVNDAGEIVLGAQQIYHVDIKNSMKKSILDHLIASSFADTFGIVFDKID